MNISTFSRYGLRALTRLVIISRNDTSKPVSVKKIADDENISMKYLEAIFSKLKKCEVIKAIRGKYGGYVLSAPAKEITVFKILNCLEDDIALTQCVLHPDTCEKNKKSCTTHHFWRELNNNFINDLKEKHLYDLAKPHVKTESEEVTK